MRKYKTYNVYILFFTLFLSVTLLGIALYMRPIEGSLTRLGGYLSNNFSVNDDRLVFTKPLYQLAENIDDYDHYYDVIVIGDSFSRDLKTGWQNFLVNKTGLSLITFDMQKISLHDVLSSPVFISQPPRVFIYESVEYAIWLRNSSCSDDKRNIYNKKSTISPMFLSPLGAQMAFSSPSRPGVFTGDLDFDAAANYLYKMIFRNIAGLNITDVREYQLSTSNLFSNIESQTILFHYKDFSKLKISDDHIEISVCSLMEIQNEVESNHKTSFLFMPIPDKLSSYANYLRDDEFVDISIINKFYNKGLNMVRLDEYVSKAISYGVVDIYLPDDTHFSYKGYDLVSFAVCEYLIDNNILFYYENLKESCAVKFE